MRSIEYKFNHKGMAMSFWKGENIDTTIIFASGLPQYVTSYHPFVETLINMGYNLLIPKYYGTWESKGDFTLRNSIKSMDDALDLVSIGEAQELFAGKLIEIPNKNTILLGFSYGGLVCIFVDKKVNKKILLMPFVNLDLHGEKNMKMDLSFIQKAYPNVYKFNTEQILNDLRNIKYPKRLGDFTVVVGQKDNCITKAEISWLVEKYRPLLVSIKDLSHTANLSKEQFELILQKYEEGKSTKDN